MFLFVIGRITIGFLSRVCAEIGFQELQRKFIAEKSLKLIAHEYQY